MVESERARYSTALLNRLSIGLLYLEIIRRKTLLFCFAVAGLLLGLIVTLVMPPRTAEVRALLRDANVSEYSALIVPDLFALTPQDVLQRISRELSSREGLHEAVEAARARDTNTFTFIPQKMLNEDGLDLKLSPANTSGAPAQDGGIMTLSLTGTHPSIGLTILSKFLDVAQKRIKQAVVRDRQTAIALEKTRLALSIESLRPQQKSEDLLQEELRALRDEAKLKRQAELAHLREALSVASSIGLTKPSPQLGSQIMVTDLLSQKSSFNARSNTPFPLFLLGTEALAEQINVLERRASDDQDDVRILEVERDINTLRQSKVGQMVNIRGDRDPVSSAYVSEIRHLQAIESLQQPPSDFLLVSVVSSPRIVSYNDYATLVWNMLRGFALGAILGGVVIAGGFVVRATREQELT